MFKLECFKCDGTGCLDQPFDPQQRECQDCKGKGWFECTEYTTGYCYNESKPGYIEEVSGAKREDGEFVILTGSWAYLPTSKWFYKKSDALLGEVIAIEQKIAELQQKIDTLEWKRMEYKVDE